MTPRPLRAVALSALLALPAALVAAQELVLHKEGTNFYHRPACDVVRDGVGVLALSRAQAEARGYKAHPECDPARLPKVEADPVKPGAIPSSSGARPAAALVFVYIDAGKEYHRDGCKRIGKTPRKVTLDEAGKGRWPCATCRPPIRKRRQ